MVTMLVISKDGTNDSSFTEEVTYMGSVFVLSASSC